MGASGLPPTTRGHSVEWIIGIYIVVGVVKALNFATNPTVALRPQWAGSGAGLGTKLVGFCVAAVLWPLMGSSKA